MVAMGMEYYHTLKERLEEPECQRREREDSDNVSGSAKHSPGYYDIMPSGQRDREVGGSSSGSKGNGREHSPPPRDQEDPHGQPDIDEDASDDEDADSDDDIDIDIDDEYDSAIGDMSSSASTASIGSTVYEMVEENGRTYHRYKEGKYLLPNDESEQTRLNLQHYLFMATFNGKLHLAPIKKNLHNVLDIGTGTGIWAIDFAQAFPSARVVGTDLSPIQPLFVPPNCSFEVDDAEDEWMFTQRFDYVHARLLAFCFRDPFGVVRSAFEHTAPGGWFEFQDVQRVTSIDDTIKGTNLERVSDFVIESARCLGLDYDKSPQYKQWLQDAGYVDIKTVKYAWPTNSWPKSKHLKQLGKFCSENFMNALSGLCLAVLSRGRGMSKEAIEDLLDGVRKDLNNKDIHAYVPVIVIYGRKPG